MASLPAVDPTQNRTAVVSMSPAEYARLHHCTLGYVYVLLAAGRLPAKKDETGRWRISVTDDAEGR
jgi:hypothetical protein